jgi:hypothetical protein
MLNLGSEAFDALQRLKNTEDWRTLREAMQEKMSALMHNAIESGTADNCGYARGIRDVVWALEIIEAGPNAPSRATVKPTVAVNPKRALERV